jgi:hypothetical protein
MRKVEIRRHTFNHCPVRIGYTYSRNDEKRYEHKHEDAIVTVLDCLEENREATVADVGIVICVVNEVKLCLNKTDLESNLHVEK